MLATGGGYVGIGTSTPTHRLSVNGAVRAKEVIIDTGWADYVFTPGYRLPPLSEVEHQIESQGHLAGMPSAKDVAERGVSVGEVQAKLLAKIEELTLYVLAHDKELRVLKAENAELRQRVERSSLLP